MTHIWKVSLLICKQQIIYELKCCARNKKENARKFYRTLARLKSLRN